MQTKLSQERTQTLQDDIAYWKAKVSVADGSLTLYRAWISVLTLKLCGASWTTRTTIYSLRLIGSIKRSNKSRRLCKSSEMKMRNSSPRYKKRVQSLALKALN